MFAIEIESCPICTEFNLTSGILGNTAHFRCKHCGWDYNRPARDWGKVQREISKDTKKRFLVNWDSVDGTSYEMPVLADSAEEAEDKIRRDFPVNGEPFAIEI